MTLSPSLRQESREALGVPLGGVLHWVAPDGRSRCACEPADVLDRSADGFCLLVAPGGPHHRPGDRAGFELANTSGHYDAPRTVVVRWADEGSWGTTLGVQLEDPLTASADRS